MDINAMARFMQYKGWSTEMPGKFADIDFDLVAADYPPFKKLRSTRYLFKVLDLLDADTALKWQTNFEMMLKRATPGTWKYAELPRFVLCLAAKDMTADALWIVKKDLRMFKTSNYDAAAFVCDEKNRAIYCDGKTLDRISSFGIKDILLN